MELSFKCVLVTVLQQSEENSFKRISDYCHQTNVVLLKDSMLIFFFPRNTETNVENYFY